VNDALSPLDGRYRDSLGDLRQHFSELALMRERCRVEVAHALALDPVFGPLDAGVKEKAELLLAGFGPAEYQEIKRIEDTLRHDVKACEVFLRERLGLRNPNRIHFGLTSEDVNNLAYSLCVKGYLEQVQLPLSAGLIGDLATQAEAWKSVPFPARTHGQHATPTTAGKELSVYVARLLRTHRALKSLKLRGKLNGATGNYSAFQVAAPAVDWRAYERTFVESLGFEQNVATTQIEDHGSLAAYFDLVRAHNNVILDLCQDMWLYISYGYVVQRTKAGEVGSSTMPHKVNPIRFENAEGNVQLSNALLSFFSDKLSRSRMQRDLSESTVMRNIGVALGHHHLASLELRKGLAMIDLDAPRCAAELSAHPELLSEAVQSVLRTVRPDDVYTELKEHTRGKTFGPDDLARIVAELPLDVQPRLAGLTPLTYLGDAVRICEEVVQDARAERTR